MEAAILSRLSGLFDRPVIQNDLRGLYIEAMIAELLGSKWVPTGADWAGWDFEHSTGIRVEIKQSALAQTWGHSKSVPRFDIKTAKGHFKDGVTFIENKSKKRLADFYVFAWHEGTDQRDHRQWEFYILASNELPMRQKTIGLAGIRKLSGVTLSLNLKETLDNYI